MIIYVAGPLVIVMESGTEFSFPQLIVVPLSCHEVDGVRKEKERLTAAQSRLRRDLDIMKEIKHYFSFPS